MKQLSFLFSILLAMAFGCQKERLPPTAFCKAYPVIGDTTVLFEFDAGKSLNNQGFSSGLAYRWDFGNDGIWDTEWGTESASSHRFINPGVHSVLVEVADFAGVSDTASLTIETFGRNQDISTMQDPRDGKTYSIAKFRGCWWMRENLTYGKVLNPLQMQTDNGIVEQFSFAYDVTNDTAYGLYDWREAINYNFENQQGICPPGWYIPSIKEWKVLLDGFPSYYAVNLYSKNGLAELDLDNGHFLYGGRGSDPWMGLWPANRGFWASDFRRVDYNHVYLGSFILNSGTLPNEIAVGETESHEVFYNLDRIQCMAIRCIRKE
jgi:uncharacterized protein (TIGR02145 family)